jgi:hypothetical protein
MARSGISAALLAAIALALGAGAAAGGEVEGQLVGVNPLNKHILLEGGIPLAVPDGAKITINGKPGWFDQLKAGSDVTAALELRNGQYAVSRLEVTDPKLAAGADDAVATEAAALPLEMELGVPVHIQTAGRGA